MRNIYHLAGILFLQLAAVGTNAQTIDYSYEQLSTTSCNIFSTVTTIDNFEHLTTIGRPQFSDNSILLRSKHNNSTSVLSTIYSIKYPFKAGYNYKISIYYKGEKHSSDAFFPSVGLKISSTNGGTSTGTNCLGPASYSMTDEFTFVHGASGSSYAWANNLIDANPTQNYDYLLVAAFPWANTTYFDYASIYVRAIQIVETLNPIDCSSFTIQGPSQICDGSANYSLSSSVVTDNAWSFYSNNCGAFLSNTTGTSNTLTKSDDGEAILKVVLPGCTPATATKYKTVTMGPGALTGYCYPRNAVSQPLYRETYGWNILGEGGNNQAQVTAPAGAQTWELVNSYTSSGTPITFNYTGGYLNINVPYGESYAEFKVTIQTSCGAKEYLFEFIAGYSLTSYSVSPNPATSDVMVYVDEEKVKKMKLKNASDEVIQRIIVLDRSGRAVLERCYAADTKKAMLNFDGLRPDIYVVRIFNGKKWTSHKVIKK